MKHFSRTLVLAGAVIALSAGSFRLQAQDNPEPKAGEPGARPRTRGNFNPDEFRQRMLERLREQMDVKNDDEWKIIAERIEKVSEARREGFGGGFRGGPPGGGTRPDSGTASGGRTGNPDAEALQKALEAKASSEELKAKMNKLRETRKAAEAKMEKAQEELRAVLNVRQEAVAVLYGLLK